MKKSLYIYLFLTILVAQLFFSNTIFAQVAAITGPTVACVGSTITLADATPAGTWNSGNTSIATVKSATGVVTGVAAGTVTISYIATAGIAVYTITVLATPFASPITGPPTVCAGNAVTLSNTTTGGTWSSSNTALATIGATTGVLTGVSGGLVTISYVVSNSCGSVVNLTNVTINPAPNAGTITGSSMVCTSSNITLSDTATGGTWTSSDISIAKVLPTGLVSGMSPGTAIITYNVTNPCGAAIATTTITVAATAFVAIINGSSSNVCAGGGATLPLSDPTPGGVWTATNASATVSSTGIVAGVSAGTDTIMYTVTTACNSAVAIYTVIITAPPSSAGVITGPTNICTGGNITLADTVSGGTWTSSNISIAKVISTGIVTGMSTGSATISCIVSNTCGAVFATAPVTVGISPSVMPVNGTGTTLCTGATLPLNDPTTGGVWSAANANATVNSTGIVTGVAVGIDTIIYSVTTSCGSASAFYTVTIAASPVSAGTITGTSVICAGSVSTLSDATAGGTWRSSNPVVSITAGGVVTGSSAGSAIISYTVLSPCGSATATMPFTINAIPVATITGTTALCAGSIATLTVTGTNNAAIVLAPSGSLTLSATGSKTFTISPAASTTYSVSAVSLSGCSQAGTGSAIVTVNIVPSATITGTYSICAGSVATLSITGSNNAAIALTPSGATTLSATGSKTYTVSPAATTTYSIASVSLNGCSHAGSGTAIITIKAMPTATVTGTASICAGSIATLTVTGTNTAAIALSPSGTLTLSATGSKTYTVSPAATTTYTISTVSLNGCSQTGSGNATITVKPIPSATITGTGTICTGSVATLTLTGTNSATIALSPSGATTLSATGSKTYTVSPASATTYTITTVSLNGCSHAGTGSALITVNAPLTATVTGATGICTGATATYTATGAAGGTWSTGSVTSATVSATGVVNAISAGVNTVVYTVSNICGTVHANKIFTITGSPTVAAIALSRNPICYSLSATYSCATTGGTWSVSPSTLLVLGSSISAVSTVTGTGSVYYTVSNSCHSTTAVHSLTVTASCVGLREMEDPAATPISGTENYTQLTIKIYPNPSNGILFIESPVNVDVKLTSIDGRLLIDQKDVKEIQMKQLANGVYFITLFDATTGELLQTKRVLKIED